MSPGISCAIIGHHNESNATKYTQILFNIQYLDSTLRKLSVNINMQCPTFHWNSIIMYWDKNRLNDEI